MILHSFGGCHSASSNRYNSLLKLEENLTTIEYLLSARAVEMNHIHCPTFETIHLTLFPSESTSIFSFHVAPVLHQCSYCACASCIVTIFAQNFHCSTSDVRSSLLIFGSFPADNFFIFLLRALSKLPVDSDNNWFSSSLTPHSFISAYLGLILSSKL